MSAIIKSETISRRKALSLMGLAAAFGLAAAPTVLTVSDAEAQTAAAPTARLPPLRLRPLAWSGVSSGVQHGTSGVRSGAQRAQSGVRSGAQVQLPTAQLQLPAQVQVIPLARRSVRPADLWVQHLIHCGKNLLPPEPKGGAKCPRGPQALRATPTTCPIGNVVWPGLNGSCP